MTTSENEKKKSIVYSFFLGNPNLYKVSENKSEKGKYKFDSKLENSIAQLASASPEMHNTFIVGQTFPPPW